MHDEYDSVGDRDREGPSTPILENFPVLEQHNPEEMEGGGERSVVEADEDAETCIRCRMTDEWLQEGRSGSKGTTTTKGVEADAGIGSTMREGQNTTLSMLSLEVQGTSMHSEEPQ
mgnify:FL=1